MNREKLTAVLTACNRLGFGLIAVMGPCLLAFPAYGFSVDLVECPLLVLVMLGFTQELDTVLHRED